MDEQLAQQLVLRFSLATFLEAVRLYDDGIASAEEIDIAMRAGAGIKMGPLAWADERGLDQVLDDLVQLEHAFGARFSPPRSLEQRVHQGQLGVKTGLGYLSHAANGGRP